MGDARHFLVNRNSAGYYTSRTPDFRGVSDPMGVFGTDMTKGADRTWDFGPEGRSGSVTSRYPILPSISRPQSACEGDNMAQRTEEGVKIENAQDLKPQILNINHVGSLYGNSNQSRSYYTVNPEWISEAVSDPQPAPMHRPPWPWEQPRYRVNMQIPITYTTPDQGIPKVDEAKELQKEEDRFCQQEIPPISYQLSQMYKSTHPEYVMKY